MRGGARESKVVEGVEIEARARNKGLGGRVVEERYISGKKGFNGDG